MFRMGLIEDETPPHTKLLKIGDVVEVAPRVAQSLRGEKGQRWYAVHTGSRCERKVQRDLERANYPTIVLLYMLDGSRPRNLMPRYVFARFDARDPWGEIEQIDGVVQVVRKSDLPIPIPAKELADLAMECLAGLHDRRGYRRPQPENPLHALARLGKINKYRHKSSKKPGKWVLRKRTRDERKAKRKARVLMARLAKYQKQ